MNVFFAVIPNDKCGYNMRVSDLANSHYKVLHIAPKEIETYVFLRRRIPSNE